MTRVAAPVVAAAAAWAAASGVVAARGPDLVARSAYLMGTRVDLSVWAASRAEGLVRLERALEALEDTERQISTWREDSLLSALNGSPLHVPWHADLATCALLAAVADWHAASSGAFDPAIGSLIEAWDLRGAGRVPRPGALARARAASGLRHFEVDRAGCTVTRRGPATIDAGAFGKGEALDRAARHLDGLPWHVNLGGQVSVGGRPPGRHGWRVAVAYPDDRTRPLLHVSLRDGSLATSGGSERDLVAGGQRIGHILDPRTGAPAVFRGSVSVWHQSGLVADILSTALFVMGRDPGVRWAEARGLAACYLEIGPDGRVATSMTPAFGALLAGSPPARGLGR